MSYSIGIRGVWRWLLLMLPLSFLCTDASRCARDLPPLPGEAMPDTVSLAQRQAAWVDSVMATLSPRARLLQSMVVSAYSLEDRRGEKRVLELVKQGVGGVIFFQGSTWRQDSLTRLYQAASTVPLLVCLDAEWGTGMRLSDGMHYPRAMGLGATGLPQLSYRVGRSLGANLRALGVHVSFSPVVDVNREQANPIVGLRAFGDRPSDVATHGVAMQMGLQSVGILPCVKHFPGHGALKVDSHKGLPLQPADRAQLDSTDLLPFRHAVNAGVGMLMVGHIEAPVLGCRKGEPASLSRGVMRFIRDSLKFNGLICTDALNMAGALVGGHPADSVAYLAYTAGCDILLCVDDALGTLRLLERALAAGRITQAEVDARCRRVLEAKWRYVVSPSSFTQDSEGWKPRASDSALVEEVSVAALTLLQGDRVPLGSTRDERVGYLSLLGKSSDYVGPMLARFIEYTPLASEELKGETPEQQAKRIAGNRSVVVVSLRAMGLTPAGRFGLKRRDVELVQALANHCPTVVLLFGSPYGVLHLGTPDRFAGLLLGYGDTRAEQEAAAQALVGAKRIEGTLPVDLSPLYPRGTGLARTDRLRLGYCSPAYLGADSLWIARADSLARLALDSAATPGFQVLAAKDGEIFYQRALGTCTYGTSFGEAVSDSTLYDVASLTKVLVTVPLVMHFVERGLLRLEDTVGRYLAPFRGSAVGKVRVEELLLHTSGLPAGYSFVQPMLENLLPQSPLMSRTGSANYPHWMGGAFFLGRDVVFSPRWIRDRQSDEFSVPVSRDLWGAKGMRDSMMGMIRRLRVDPKKPYLYSDLGFMLLGWIVEQVGREAGDGDSLGQLAQRLVFTPCGFKESGFSPWARGLRDRCAPSCYDALFRKAVVQGYAHDISAALMGGEAGHAGLFSNAHDIAVIAQILLQNGEYGGQRFFSERTVAQFTSLVEGSRGRYYGFSCKTAGTSRALVGESLGANSFGHLGFTGSVLWLDPEQHFLFIFLSNRTWPFDRNNRLNSLSIRGGIMEAIYRSLTPAR